MRNLRDQEDFGIFLGEREELEGGEMREWVVRGE